MTRDFNKNKTKQRTDNTMQILARQLNRPFAQEDIQMTDKPMKM